MAEPALAACEGQHDIFRLDGLTAVVTGASGGLGARFVEVLLAAGANVVGAARRADRLAQVCGSSQKAHGVVCDLTNPDDRKRLVDSTVDTFGAIDVLINNAGATHTAPAENEPLERFREVIELNLVATYNLTQLAAAVMIGGRGGTIINVTSMLGLVGIGQVPQASYTASKGALINLTRELAIQWARRNVTVNALAPGFFLTEMTDDLLSTPKGQEWLRNKTPVGRAGLHHELDAALLFLSSPANRFMTGQTIVVDGGWTAA
jgi:NAD(P)-dependent dehydrogenase (short-subunit alcohol dehydrogenase family)